LKNYTYDSSYEKPFLHKSLLEGDIDYPELLKEMNHQYQGCLSLEPEVDYEDTITSMKELTRINNR
jgi:sugar phosphate isomerase/epimerase